MLGGRIAFGFGDQVGIDDEAAIRMAKMVMEKQARKLFEEHGLRPEPVTEPLADEPVGGEPAHLKGPSKTVEEFSARNPAVKGDSATARAIGPLDAETEPPAPAKKAKRERRRKK